MSDPKLMIINIKVSTTDKIELPFGGITNLTIDWGDDCIITYTSLPIKYLYRWRRV